MRWLAVGMFVFMGLIMFGYMSSADEIAAMDAELNVVPQQAALHKVVR